MSVILSDKNMEIKKHGFKSDVRWYWMKWYVPSDAKWGEVIPTKYDWSDTKWYKVLISDTNWHEVILIQKDSNSSDTK